MTCREKLKIEQPDKVCEAYRGGCCGCPKGYGYLPDPEYCKHIADSELCTKCWDREIPGTNNTKEEVKMDTNKTYTFEDVYQMSEYEKNDLVMELQKDKANLEMKCRNLDELLDLYRNENKNLNDAIEKKKQNIAKLKTDIERWNKSYAYLVEQYGALEKKVEDAETCCKGRVVQCNELADKVKELEKDNDELNRLIGEREQTIEARKRENEELKKQANDLVEELARINYKNYDLRMKIEYRDNKIAELESANTLKNKDLEEKNDFIKYLEEKIDKLEDPVFLPNCLAQTLHEKCMKKFEHPYCKSVPCSEAIKQLENKVNDIPCIKSKIKPVDKFIASCWDDKTSTKAKEAYDYLIEDMRRTRELYEKHYLCKWVNNDSPYDKVAEHMMRKYKALRNAGFDHEDAMSLIPMWSDD